MKQCNFVDFSDNAYYLYDDGIYYRAVSNENMGFLAVNSNCVVNYRLITSICLCLGIRRLLLLVVR